MIIRKADHKDIDGLTKIRLAYLSEDHGGLSDQETAALVGQLPGYFASHLGKDFIAFLAEEGELFVASVFLVISEKPANLNFITGKTGTILNVYTQPEYRRQGLAGQLMKLAMEEAGKHNLSYLELSASKDGYPLYRKLGFAETKSNFTPMKYNL